MNLVSDEFIEEQTPSRRDGINKTVEDRARKTYSGFITNLGRSLNLPQITIASAIIVCHRFFTVHSLAKNDSLAVSTACLFLASKFTDYQKKLKYVVVASQALLIKVPWYKNKTDAEKWGNMVVNAEKMLIRLMGFEFFVDTGYPHLKDGVLAMRVSDTDSRVLQIAWNFLNDALYTTVYVQYKPKSIAGACFYMAWKVLDVKMPNDTEKKWIKVFETNPSEVEEISKILLCLYECKRMFDNVKKCNNTSPFSPDAIGSSASLHATPSPFSEEEYQNHNHKTSRS